MPLFFSEIEAMGGKPKKLKCDKCDISLSSQGLKLHKESVHEKRRFVCVKCNKTFTQKSNLQIHIKSIHEGERVICKFCNKLISAESNLTNHINETYDCKKCDMKFKICK